MEKKTNVSTVTKEQLNAKREALLSSSAEIVKNSKTIRSLGSEQDRYPIFSFGEAKTKGAIEKVKEGKAVYLPEGSVIAATFLGVVPMVVLGNKEGWDKWSYRGRTGNVRGKEGKFSFSFHYLFRKNDGELFGVYECPMLRILLRNIPTLSSKMSGGTIDPAIIINYDGLVSPEEAAEKYGFKMSIGDSTHAVRVSLIDDVEENRYAKGFVNLLSDPRAIAERLLLAENSQDKTLLENTFDNINMSDITNQIDAPQSQQIAQ